MEESILTSIKAQLGIVEEYTHFDDAIVTHINSAFATLWQIGVGPESCFVIQDKTKTWSDFSSDNALLGMVKPYVHKKVRLNWDTPTNSSVIDTLTRGIKEDEWRIYAMASEWQSSKDETGNNEDE